MIRRSGSRRRRGAIYLIVLGVTMIVSVMALASLAVSRLELRANAAAVDRREARVLARSAVEFGMAYLENQAAWRVDLTNNSVVTTVALGPGTIEFKVVDPDGDLDNGDTDGCTLYGFGRVGNAVAVESVELQPAGQALNCLEVAMHCDGDIVMSEGSLLGPHRLRTNQTVSANGVIDFSANYTELDGEAWATGIVTGSITGPMFQSQSPPREMPGSDVFDYYTSNGAWIDIADLPINSGKRLLERVVISPAIAPAGEPNAEGIYVIDCQGQNLCIRETRVLGTLVLLNPGPNCETDRAVLMQPAVGNYPVLLVDGDFRIGASTLPLSESSTFGSNTNFNPAGAPYDDVEDSDLSDTYPSELQGLVYIAGTARFEGIDFPRVNGCLVCGAVNAATTFTADYRETFFLYPPPGFRAGDSMQIIPGTWRRARADAP